MSDRDSSIEKTKKMPQKRIVKSAREVALELLHQLFQHPEDGTPLPVMLVRAVQAHSLEPRDGAFLSETVYGVLRRSILLDSLLAGFLKKPEALSPQIRMLLRIGSYEMLFMDAIPARATVNELVGLSRRRFGQRLSGLVNGVLRSIDRDAESLRSRIRSAKAADSASIPAWLMALWEEQYGAESAESIAFNTLEHAAPCWRVNMSREKALDLRDEWLARGYQPVGKSGFTSYGLARDRSDVREEQQMLSDLELQGAVTRQGISSQLVAENIAEWLSNDATLSEAELWDACCGRGGKTTALLEKGIKVTLSSDPSSYRVEDLRASVERLGLAMPKIVCAPAQDVDVTYPLILLDVPCSGTGTLGRAPELRLRLSPERLSEAERLQGLILENAWSKLQAGGVLFYVTCALNRCENEGQIEAFMARHGCQNGGDAHLQEHRLFLPLIPGHDALFFSILRKQN